MSTVESYLMANRGSAPFEEYQAHVRQLAQSTLAYFLADEGGKSSLVQLFELATDHVEALAPEVERQSSFAKTLLSVEDAVLIEGWTKQNRDLLLGLQSNSDWLVAVWPILGQVVKNKFFGNVLPDEVPLRLASAWLSGASYGEIVAIATSSKATKPWGDTRTRTVNEADVLDFLEGCLSFECSLVLAAVAQFLFGSRSQDEEAGSALRRFQKALKYGLPDPLSVSCFELGFADRVVSQALSVTLTQVGYSKEFADLGFAEHREAVAGVLDDYPSYFVELLNIA